MPRAHPHRSGGRRGARCRVRGGLDDDGTSLCRRPPNRPSGHVVFELAADRTTWRPVARAGPAL